MDVIRFIPGQAVMDGRKNRDGDPLLIELSPLWQDGEYHFIVKNAKYPWRAYEHVNKHGLDIDGVRRVEPVVEYNSWAWMEPAHGLPAWYKCRRIPGFATLVQFESEIPGVMLHNGGGKVPDGRAWWMAPSRVVDGDEPLAPKRKATTPVSTTGWGDDDDESVGEHTLPPLPAFEAVHVDELVNVAPAAPTPVLPADWRDRVWQAYATTGGEMTKLIQDYKQLYQAE